MHTSLEEQSENATNSLLSYLSICMEALNEFSQNNPSSLMPFEKEKIIKLIARMFDGELDYLGRNPEDYIELYNEEL